MKILFITNYFYPEPFRNNELAKELVKRGHKVTVLTSYPSYPIGKIYDGYGYDVPYEKSYEGVLIERLKSAPRGKTPIGLINNCISFVKLGKEWVDNCKDKFDIVYYPAISPCTSGIVAKYYKDKFKTTKMIIHVQDLWPENIKEVLHINFAPLLVYIKNIMKDIYNASDYILCSSKSFVEYIIKSFSNSLVVKYWPQFYIEPNIEKLEVPKEYQNISKNTIKVAFTGNIGYAQGLDLLIDSAKYIKDVDSSLDIKWFIVGDGRAKKELIDRVSKYNLNEDIIFTGRKLLDESNSYSYYADLSYLSFKNDFFNMTIPAKLQGYLACKSPILCVAGGESSKIVSDNRCGLVADKNPESIYKKLIEYKNMSIQEKNKLKENAYKCYKENFTIDKLIDELEKYME